MTPPCPNCSTPMLRWSWFEVPFEPYWYWYCLECDREGRSPYIFCLEKSYEQIKKETLKMHAHAVAEAIISLFNG